MQTFLPFSDFIHSIRCLDYRRLGKQRVEAFQLLVTNGDEWAIEERRKRIGKTDRPKGWVNHPAATMWRGYNEALSIYMNLCIQEWKNRGYNNTMNIRGYLYDEFFTMNHYESMVDMPPWLGLNQLHMSHRSNLLRKDPGFYSKFGWTEPDNIDYYWPT